MGSNIAPSRASRSMRLPATRPCQARRCISTSSQNRISEARDERACAALSADAGCVAQAETCTSSDPVTRTINGVAVTRPCWAWEKSYQCSRAVPAQDCGSLDANPACSFARRECLSEDEPCTTWERIYRCAIPDQVGPDKQYICDGDIYCINGDCETIDRQPNAEFKDAAVALNAAAQARTRVRSRHAQPVQGHAQHLQERGVRRAQLLQGQGVSADPRQSAARRARLQPRGDPAPPARCARAVPLCRQLLLEQRARRLRHQAKAYCCFESKLSRILQEQGRPQIGKPWGTPKRETCLGFTVDEFARLDLSARWISPKSMPSSRTPRGSPRS